MLGIYVAYSAVGWLMPVLGGAGFWVGVVVAAVVVGLSGALVEILLLRRIYRSPELFQLPMGQLSVSQHLHRAVKQSRLVELMLNAFR